MSNSCLFKAQRKQLVKRLNNIYSFPLESFNFKFVSKYNLAVYDYDYSKDCVLNFYVDMNKSELIYLEKSYGVFVSEIQKIINKFLKEV